jgi:hypothetical protein
MTSVDVATEHYPHDGSKLTPVGQEILAIFHCSRDSCPAIFMRIALKEKNSLSRDEFAGDVGCDG